MTSFERILFLSLIPNQDDAETAIEILDGAAESAPYVLDAESHSDFAAWLKANRAEHLALLNQSIIDDAETAALY